MTFNPNKFRFILIDADGDVSGTNDEDLAMTFSHNEQNIVVDCENQDLIYEGLIVPVEATSYEPEGSGDDESENEEEPHPNEPGG